MLLICAVAAGAAARQRPEAEPRDRSRSEDATRRQDAILVALVDAAMAGQPAADFSLAWRNDFFKAQTGTFVPFSVTVDRAVVGGTKALMYVRAVKRGAEPATGGAAVRYPFDLVFPVELPAGASGPIRITRGFAVPPGEYDVYVAVLESRADPEAAGLRPRAAVLKQPLSVPDFWTGELATSSVLIADRIDTLASAPAPEEVLERPYIIGDSEIHPVEEATFRRDRELIVVFLIYNPTLAPDRGFDIQVDYHLFRSEPDGETAAEPAGDHPPARSGERYVTRTSPQRFRPGAMGPQFDPAAGQPMLAGQGILLSSFREGAYRLGITVTDLLSRRTLSRDVLFRVVGS